MNRRWNNDEKINYSKNKMSRKMKSFKLNSELMKYLKNSKSKNISGKHFKICHSTEDNIMKNMVICSNFNMPVGSMVKTKLLFSFPLNSQ